MIYKMQPPAPGLEHLINCYWLIDSEENTSIERQKIVPDGYPEIILHYGDPYRINLGDGWETQEKQLLAGQIKKHFYLENTGHSGMLGIKLQPASLAHLFDYQMAVFTNKVIPLPTALKKLFSGLSFTATPAPEAHFSAIDDIFESLIVGKRLEASPIDQAVSLVLSQKGNVDVQSLREYVNLSERSLERLFKRYVGLSSKFYSRIIRLGHIFELMQQDDPNWSDLVYHSGFYDQSHFIKNFKEFTGEDPSAYGFEEENMANFHLRK